MIINVTTGTPIPLWLHSAHPVGPALIMWSVWELWPGGMWWHSCKHTIQLLHNSCLPGHLPAVFHSFTRGWMSSPQLLYSLGYSMQVLCWLEECNYYEQYCWLGEETFARERKRVRFFFCNYALKVQLIMWCRIGLVEVLTLRWQFLLLFGQWQTLLWLLQRHDPLSASSWCSSGE